MKTGDELMSEFMTEAEKAISNENELIAEFLGWRMVQDSGYRLPKWYEPAKDKRKKGAFKGYSHQLIFHVSWDSLMLVIDKIERDNNLKFSITTGYVKIGPLGPYNQNIFTNCSHEGGKLNACYKAVVGFIKWSNQSAIKTTATGPTTLNA
jgi:hypothetical protein